MRTSLSGVFQGSREIGAGAGPGQGGARPGQNGAGPVHSGSRKSGLRAFVPVALLLSVLVLLALVKPDAAILSATASWDYLKEVMLILPGIMILMGLFEVWVPKSAIQRLMGQGSGLGGVVLAIGLGTAPTGPLYVAFPIAAGLARKGASTFNLVVFLSTWAALKLPQVMMEAKFLGLDFALTRLALTLVGMMLMAYAANRLLPGWVPSDVPPTASKAGGQQAGASPG